VVGSAAVTTLDERRRRWAAQSAALAVLEDRELARLSTGSPFGSWGVSGEAVLADGSKVFVKRLPLSDLEHERTHSTRNHFRLPLVYQYGVGSAGFGVWRELAAHVRTTGWVLAGECEGFPLLLHHRVLRRPAAKQPPDSGWIDTPEYVRYWNGSKRLGAFIDARRVGTHELWLVLEHVPHRLFEWLGQHQEATADVTDQLLATVRFLNGRGMVHFDAHAGNVLVTEDGRIRLADLGLANHRSFLLTAAEHAFLDRHRHYDLGEALHGIGSVLGGLLRAAPDAAAVTADLRRRFGVEEVGAEVLVANVEALADEGLLGVTPAYAEVVARHRPVILFLHAFFRAMQQNPRKDTPFDDERLGRLLAEVT
jgi:hypothetical protein